MSEFTKGEMKTDGQDAIRVGDTEVAHMCSNFDWKVRRATAEEISRRWNSQPDLLKACKYTETLLSKGTGQTTHALALIEAAIAKQP